MSEDLGFDIETVSQEDARALEKSTGSKYESVAEKWREARKTGEAIIIKDVDAGVVSSIRTFMYNTFDKHDVIVRSKRKGEDNFNVIIRQRVDDEFLPDSSQDDSPEIGDTKAFSAEATDAEGEDLTDEEYQEASKEADEFMST